MGFASIKHRVSSPTAKKVEWAKNTGTKNTGTKIPGSRVHRSDKDQALRMPCEHRGWEDTATEQYTEQGCFLLPSAVLLER